MSDDWLFKHEDGRLFREDGGGKGRDPVVGDWLGFDEDIVFVTKQTGPRSYDVVEHPMCAEIMATMLDGPAETSVARANQINRDYAASRTPPMLITIICRQCGESGDAMEMDVHIDQGRCMRGLHAHIERARASTNALRAERDEARQDASRLAADLLAANAELAKLRSYPRPGRALGGMAPSRARELAMELVVGAATAERPEVDHPTRIKTDTGDEVVLRGLLLLVDDAGGKLIYVQAVELAHALLVAAHAEAATWVIDEGP